MARILIVDDNEQHRYLGKVLLESHDHQVLPAKNGVEALQIAHDEQGRIDLLVTDILMPDMDGFTLCRTWKADESLRSVPVIFYTATYTDQRDEELARSLGAADFLRKPSEPSKVLAAVEEVLSGKRTAEPGPVDVAGETLFLQRYNAALVRKLESKVAQLERTQASVDASATPIMWIGREGAVTYANTAAHRVFGADLVMARRKIWELDLGCDEQSWRDRYWGGEGGQLTTSYRRADGGTFPAEVSISFWERPDTAHAVLFVADITGRRALRDQLVQAQRIEAMGHIATGIAHDFNNLLGAVDGLIELARDDVGNPDDLLIDLDEIAAAVERAKELTNQLVAFGRQQELAPAPLDVNQVITEFAGLLRQAVRPRCQLSLDLAEDAGRLVADRTQLERVLMNLVINARDALPEGGPIRIETAPAGAFVRVRVADEGVGMDDETMARVFEPFFTTKSQADGTGLGLSTVYGIVEQSGGRIAVDSAPGKGTRVDVFLPVAPDEAERASEGG